MQNEIKIKGGNSKQAAKYPEISKLLITAATFRSVSDLVYESIALVCHICGFVPDNKDDTRDLIKMIELFNKHGTYLRITSLGNEPIIDISPDANSEDIFSRSDDVSSLVESESIIDSGDLNEDDNLI